MVNSSLFVSDRSYDRSKHKSNDTDRIFQISTSKGTDIIIDVTIMVRSRITRTSVEYGIELSQLLVIRSMLKGPKIKKDRKVIKIYLHGQYHKLRSILMTERRLMVCIPN